MSGKRQSDTIGHPIRIERQQLGPTLEKNANSIGKAATEFAARLDGVRVVPLDLFRTLRV
jgi:hypothetical protein